MGKRHILQDRLRQIEAVPEVGKTQTYGNVRATYSAGTNVPRTGEAVVRAGMATILLRGRNVGNGNDYQTPANPICRQYQMAAFMDETSLAV